MIVFDLKCGGGHVFEAWFGSSADYDTQRESGLVACPLCGDTGVAKAVMAPNVAAKGNSRSEPTVPLASSGAPAPEAMKAMLGEMAKLQAKLLEGSSWVGRDFAERARAMHHGERERESIHGEATPQEAKALIDEGIEVAPLPLPVVPPDATN